MYNQYAIRCSQAAYVCTKHITPCFSLLECLPHFLSLSRSLTLLLDLFLTFLVVFSYSFSSLSLSLTYITLTHTATHGVSDDLCIASPGHSHTLKKESVSRTPSSSHFVNLSCSMLCGHPHKRAEQEEEEEEVNSCLKVIFMLNGKLGQEERAR